MIENCKVNDCRKCELVAVIDDACKWFDSHRPQWGPGTLPTWYVDGKALLQEANTGSVT